MACDAANADLVNPYPGHTGRVNPLPLVTKSGVAHPGVIWIGLIKEAGLNQRQVADKMGVSAMTVSRNVHGYVIPTARIAVLFARAMGLAPWQVWQMVADYELALALEDW